MTHRTIQKTWDLIGVQLIFARQQRQDIGPYEKTVEIHHKLWRPGWMAHKLLDNVKTLNRDCSDPRDRTYALLSLRAEDDIDPDYYKSTSDVYTDFARAYLQRGESRIFSSAGLQRIANRPDCPRLKSSDNASGLLKYHSPSWAPDWRADRPYMQLGGSNRVNFSAGATLSPEIKFKPPRTHDSCFEHRY